MAGAPIVFPGVRIERGEAAAAERAIREYDSLCRQVEEAVTIDAARGINDQAEAIRVWAVRAGNRRLEVMAAEIRIRAERRLGILIPQAQEAGLLRRPGQRARSGSPEEPLPPTLEDMRIGKKLSAEAQALAKLPDFDKRLEQWRDGIELAGNKVTVRLLKPKPARHEHDFYPTPHSIIRALLLRWRAREGRVWEPFAGDGRVAKALAEQGHRVYASDIVLGEDFFALDALPRIDGAPVEALCSNPPFERIREMIDRAFALGVRQMALVCPERLWASDVGARQFARHRPAVWANLSWREDYLGRGGNPDRALGVAIWNGPCAERCDFEIWERPEGERG